MTDAQALLNEIYDSKIAEREAVVERWLSRLAPAISFSEMHLEAGAGAIFCEIELGKKSKKPPNVYELARACLNAAIGASWHAIDTAPKMKNILLFAVTDIGENGEIKNWKMDTGYWSAGSNGWVWSGYQLRSYDIQPTHWVCCPKPPAIEKPKIFRNAFDEPTTIEPFGELDAQPPAA